MVNKDFEKEVPTVSVWHERRYSNSNCWHDRFVRMLNLFVGVAWGPLNRLNPWSCVTGHSFGVALRSEPVMTWRCRYGTVTSRGRSYIAANIELDCERQPNGNNGGVLLLPPSAPERSRLVSSRSFSTSERFASRSLTPDETSPSALTLLRPKRATKLRMATPTCLLFCAAFGGNAEFWRNVCIFAVFVHI